jgi:hypothetical protein
MLSKEFQKKFDAQKDTYHKASVKLDYMLFMQKMDSVENIALTGALLKTKNLEDLGKLHLIKKSFPLEAQAYISPAIDKAPDYPGGMNELRQEIVHHFYLAGVHSDIKTVKTNVAFIVEKDGSITNVQAQGENFTFNRQAEIALYSITQKFSPAIANGDPVRYRFRLPLAMNLE